MDSFLASFGLDRISFDSLLPTPWLIALGVAIFLAALMIAMGRLKSSFPRLVAGLALILALLNPQIVTEDRQALPDTVIILKDASQSMQIGQREALMAEASSTLAQRLAAEDALDVITVQIPESEDGTQLAKTLTEALGNAPASRLAGVIALTDGRPHDVSEATADIMPEGVPFHAFILGDPNARDRRIAATVAPKFGVVGEQAEFVLQVDDPGFEGERAQIEVKLNGTIKARFPITIGRPVSIPLEIEKRGSNTVEMSVAAVEGELTTNNNLFVSEISGIRDRLRVLLITGEPHNGGRAWRNLLKSDPALDLVQFTILTVPRVKRTNARESELSLIQFPTRQLFEEKLDEFDLIIFDQYQRRSMSVARGRARPTIPPQYFQNIANYVEDGGALLLATGPAFATENSLFRTALASILPTRPTGEISEGAYRPVLNSKGQRHPITASFTGETSASWGQWYRAIDNNPVSGNVLMDGPDGVPLFVIDKVGDGRVAMLMSDHAWLWAKGHDGGGPYREIFRRTAHWLMGEPDLESEILKATADGGRLQIERRSLNDVTGDVEVKYPDGTSVRTSLTQVADGVYQGDVPIKGQGAYRLQNGDVSTITAIGALNPREFSELLPTTDILAPLSEASGGLTKLLGVDASALPDFRRVSSGRATSGSNWAGLVAHNDYTVTKSRRTPLAPGLIFFGLFFLFLAWAWRREGL
ncbi:hypothetical protein ACJ3XI_03545 [Litorimonas sp. RW-G-Af-16]|uniref:hypothetical protein n=1 Tax=Litorimonas sp. RW-G-Af-16 TaxID=3241168 RepID=UPI00390CB633